ncbi:rab-GTPase-TBC domain-containing protein [Flammula alnicola]|nr:rab-GTPase-TBC domain-containing protein [Flammula alnicola]
MLSDEGFTNADTKPKRPEVDWEGLRAKSLEQGGFGEERVDIWPKLLHASKQKLQIEEELLINSSENEKSPHQDERQIGLDTDRSFVLYPVEPKIDREILQAGLHQLLVSLFRKRPRLSYFQGYHDIVTVFFLTLPPELQLPCVEKLSLHRLRDSMGLGLEPVLGLLRVTKNLLRLADPDYARILEQTSPLPFYALSNLLTLFSHDMPTLPLIQHVFDYLLSRPPVASVYLASAIILSRKQEVIRLEEEEEEGMIHSLLSSLPHLADGPFDVQKDEDDTFPWKKEDSVADNDNTFFKEDGEPNPLTTSATDVRSEDTKAGDNDDPISDDEKAPSDSRRPPDDLENSPETLGPTIGSNEIPPQNNDSISEVSEHTSEVSEHPPKEDGDTDSLSSSKNSQIPANGTTTSVVNPVKIEESDIPSPTVHAQFKAPMLILTDLLKQADELYEKFPPSHSGLALSSIMGPQSVVFTWSESLSALPSDHTAEAMVSHPELVVYSYVEVDYDQKESPSSSKAGKEAGKARRKRRKLRKSPFGQMEKKTMLAGTVLVLGVAMAVYGIKARNAAGGHGLFYFADGHAHHGSAKDWKRLGGWLGGALAGISQKIANGLSSGS